MLLCRVSWIFWLSLQPSLFSLSSPHVLKLCKSRFVVLKNIPRSEFVYSLFFQCHLTNFYLSLINEVSCESGWGLGSGFLFLLKQHFIGKAVCHVMSHFRTTMTACFIFSDARLISGYKSWQSNPISMKHLITFNLLFSLIYSHCPNPLFISLGVVKKKKTAYSFNAFTFLAGILQWRTFFHQLEIYDYLEIYWTQERQADVLLLKGLVFRVIALVISNDVQ